MKKFFVGLRIAMNLSLRADRRGSWLTLFLFAVRPVTTVGIFWLFAALADAAVHGDDRSVMIISLMAGILLCASILLSRSALAIDSNMIELSDHLLDKTLFELCVCKLTVTDFESSKVLDALDFVQQERRHLTEGIDVLALLLGALVRLTLTMLLLGSVDIRLLALLAVAVVVVRINQHASDIRSAGLMKASAYRRRATVLCDLFKDENVSFEIRSYGHAAYLLSAARDDFRNSIRQMSKSHLKAALFASFGWLIFGVGYAAALYWVVQGFLHGHARAGEVVLAVLLISSVVTQLGSLIFFSTALMRVSAVGQAFGIVYQRAKQNATLPMTSEADCDTDRSAAIGADVFPADTRLPMELGLKMEHVSFRYEGTSRLALKDINLSIPPGSVVALVGENGAGKSTLTKLLLGLYEPQEGSIRVAGMPPSLLVGKHRISASFQDFTKFEFPLRDVIGCGDIREATRERIEESLAAVDGLSLLDELPNGLDTRIGTSFPDGRQLSGGQWQKTALARSLMPRDVVLLALDEPTAAVDPLSEARLLESYFRRARALAVEAGSIVLIVTHRLNSIEIADLVLYMDDGRIAECGTHGELMELNGGYADLYLTQKKAYV